MNTFGKAFSVLDSSLSGGVVANTFLAAAMGASMKRMWSLLNTLQIITHIPLLALKLPSNLKVCLNTIISVSSLSIIPKSLIDKVYEKFKISKNNQTSSVS
jgi:hypothetical protein